MYSDHRRWRELRRLEQLCIRYQCDKDRQPHWLCNALRDSIEWHRKWLLRNRRLHSAVVTSGERETAEQV